MTLIVTLSQRKKKKKKTEKNDVFDSVKSLYKGRELVINGLKILTFEKILQRLPIALAQVKAGNNSENLLNEMRQIVYPLCQSEEITRKVYNSIQNNSIQS